MNGKKRRQMMEFMNGKLIFNTKGELYYDY